jgi:hypothetical protein
MSTVENSQMTKAEIEAATSGVRFNKGKLQWGLVPWHALHPMLHVLDFGEKK